MGGRSGSVRVLCLRRLVCMACLLHLMPDVREGRHLGRLPDQDKALQEALWRAPDIVTREMYAAVGIA